MPEDFDEDDPAYLAARRHVVKLKAFYLSLATYLVTNVLLFAVDALTGDGWWFLWVTVFWGIAVAFQGVGVFADGWGRAWEDRKVREVMARDRKV